MFNAHGFFFRSKRALALSYASGVRRCQSAGRLSQIATFLIEKKTTKKTGKETLSKICFGQSWWSVQEASSKKDAEMVVPLAPSQGSWPADSRRPFARKSMKHHPPRNRIKSMKNPPTRNRTRDLEISAEQLQSPALPTEL